MHGHNRRPAARSRRYKLVTAAITGNENEEASTPVVDWRTLDEGTRVEIREDRDPIARGWIDDVTTDGTVIWIVREDGAGRILVEQTKTTTVHLLEARQSPAGQAPFLTSRARP